MNSSELAIGIDLGTSTSILSVLRDGKPFAIPDPQTKTPIVPSVVGLNRRGELEAGQAALNAVTDPTRLIREAKRAMGTSTTFQLGQHTLRAEEVAALVLRKMAAVGESYLGVPVRKAVITVPAYFGDLERRATLRAAELAGIGAIRLISEPVAAAAAFGLDNHSFEGTVLVFDMGGGTLDVTLLEMIEGVLEVKASHGDKHLGGKDIDEILMNHALAEFRREHPGAEPSQAAMERLKRAAESAKKMLSESEVADIVVENFAAHEGDVAELCVTVERRQFESLIRPLIDRAIQTVDQTLEKAGASKGDIDRLLLVGGATYIPAIREAVVRHIGKPALSGVDPDLAVSQGAAISAGLALGTLDSTREQTVAIVDSNTHGIGVRVLHIEEYDAYPTYDELIAPNTPIPYFTKRMYSLLRPDQTELEMHVFQDVRNTKVLEDCVPTGVSGVITDIPPALYGEPHKVEVEFSYDQNHIVQIKATVVGVGKSTTVRLHADELSQSDEEMAQAARNIDQLWQSSPLAKTNEKLIERAQTAIREGHPKGELIEALVVELKTKISANDAEGVRATRQKLVDVLAEV
ncbi:MAG: Hsp70 family protein [Armatimonadetes bacterium]|nr:Hsp70 family protein [Armatimonadota bacterium]